MLNTKELIKLLDTCILICKEDQYCSSVVCTLTNLLVIVSDRASKTNSVLKSVNRFWGNGEGYSNESLWAVFDNFAIAVHVIERDSRRYPSVHKICFDFSSRLWNMYHDLRDHLFPISHPLRDELMEYVSLIKSINTLAAYQTELSVLVNVIDDIEKIKFRLGTILYQSLLPKAEEDISLA